jgi:hypothetical protein
MADTTFNQLKDKKNPHDRLRNGGKLLAVSRMGGSVLTPPPTQRRLAGTSSPTQYHEEENLRAPTLRLVATPDPEEDAPAPTLRLVAIPDPEENAPAPTLPQGLSESGKARIRELQAK